MRQFIFSLFLCLALAPLYGFVAVEEREPDYSSLSTEDQNLLRGLDNMGWVRLGQPSDKIAYIIAAPWCPYCKALYQNIDTVNGFELRWIMLDPRTDRDRAVISETVLNPSKDLLDMTHLQPYTEFDVQQHPYRDYAVDFMSMSMIGIDDDFKRRGWKLIYPSMVYVGHDNAVHVTTPENGMFTGVEQMIKPIPGEMGHNPQMRHLLTLPVERESFHARNIFAKKDGTTLRSIPHETGFPVHVLTKDDGFQTKSMINVNGEIWFEIELFPGTPMGPAYVKSSEMTD